jgi:Swt1-like HEPN
LEYDAFLKSFAEMQKTLGTSSYAKALSDLHRSMAIEATPAYATAIIEASRTARSMEENMSLSFEKLGLASLAASTRFSEAVRLATGPLTEMQQSGFFAAFANQPRIEAIQAEMATFESRFRLPPFAEAAHLVEGFREIPIAASLAKYTVEMPDMKLAIESMRTPWLDILGEVSSVEAFAEIQGIGQAVARLGAFDESLSSILRTSLGDWREPITWRPEVFTDLAARSDFYVSLGFNHAITAFPLPAFEQSLDVAGLQQPVLPKLSETYEPALGARGEEEGLARTNAAHNQLQRLERMLRKFIDKQMTAAFGADWPKHRLPNGMVDQWREKKRNADAAGAEQRPLIDYADFTDYEALICKRDNWREVFGAFFTRPESVRESLQRLYPIRVDTMHARLITQDDELFLRVEVRRLVKVMPK